MSNTPMTIGLFSGNTNTSIPDDSQITLIFNVLKVRISAEGDLRLVPRYLNLLNLFFMVFFLVLYTIVVNTPNEAGEIDFAEGLLFAFVFGFFFDEVTRMSSCSLSQLTSRYKVGLMVVGFWNAYNVPFVQWL